MMTSSSFPTFFFIIITFTIKLKFATAGVSVKDIEGNILNITNKYIIWHNIPMAGGTGLTVPSDEVNNLLVIGSNPLPVTFTKSNREKVILTDDILTINFTNIPMYNGSSSWIVDYKESTHVSYVAVGSAKDYPGHQIKTGTFKIEPCDEAYKLVFCSDANNSSCKDVGIYADSADYKHVVLGGGVMLVRFQKHNI
ncbi:kunitz-type serine protease inhibitor DrTI-like [Lotus japonicus]|uniref:kunitz-type serine protease inhibitor DrTI-like n=1 Tax=Lotus japonicus TaxID=34305 RepID=UPI00258807FF|nr:kunitz-type serine protease inhibitor DrTI-like [Lotus japonicus]